MLPRLEALLGKVPAFARSKIPYGPGRAGAEKLVELGLRKLLGDDWRSVYVSRSRARELLSHLCDDVPESVKGAMRLTGMWSAVCAIDVPLAEGETPTAPPAETPPAEAPAAGVPAAAPPAAEPVPSGQSAPTPPRGQGGACGKCDASREGPFGAIPGGAVLVLMAAALWIERRRGRGEGSGS